MSFYNADPRAYFQWYEYSSLGAAQSDLNNLEVGRLVRIIDTDSQSSANNNYKIYKVAINNETKILEEFNLTNPYSMAIGEGLNDTYDDNGTVKGVDNLTIVGKYNETPSEGDLFIVGSGTTNASRRNAIKIDPMSTIVKNAVIIQNRSDSSEKVRINNQSGMIRSQGPMYLQNENQTKIFLDSSNGDIIANGSLQSDNGQLILAPVASSSTITPITGKKILNIRTVNNTDTIYIDNLAYAPQTITVTSNVKVHNSDQSGIEIAKLQSSQGGADITDGKILLPSTIAQDTTIGAENSSSDNNLIVRGITTALGGVKTNSIQPKDGATITIPSGNILKTDTITSITPTGNEATDLSLNTTGNTKIGNTAAAAGSNPETTSGLQYGNYSIKIVDTLPINASSNSTTIYIVLNDT